ncbi:hypothetical protein PAT3040_06752, partial [Paenibacillus agaridevorans]
MVGVGENIDAFFGQREQENDGRRR